MASGSSNETLRMGRRRCWLFLATYTVQDFMAHGKEKNVVAQNVVFTKRHSRSHCGKVFQSVRLRRQALLRLICEALKLKFAVDDHSG